MSKSSLSVFVLSTLALSLQSAYAQTDVPMNTESGMEVTLDEITIIGSKANVPSLTGSGYFVDQEQLENEKITDINQ
ncbi:MAG: hypothetical protein ACTHWG_07690, partial [Psychrobacter sp.]